jgi:cob(I)alamin adenosyltransferase
MGHRLTKIYTRTGDAGTTGLGDGSRVPKLSPRIQAIGTVDELNSTIGLVLCENIPDPIRDCLVDVQHDLFDLGGEISIPGHSMVTESHVIRLEQSLDLFNASLPPLKEFILPGGCRPAAQCHVARTVARRAERDLLHLDGTGEPVSVLARQYLNRLSDLLFVLARAINHAANGSDVMWDPKRAGRRSPG